MKQEAFKKKIEQGLEKLDKEQVVNFAWRCAVRALPFLGSRGDFDFWDTNVRQKHLYAVFCCLDINAFLSSIVPSVAVTYSSSYVTIDTAADAYVAGDTAANAKASAAYAANTAANANVAAGVNATNVHAANTALSAFASDREHINLEPIILQDLKNIQDNGVQHISPEQYGEIWENFQKALKSEGCEYWGQLYKRVFDNGFTVNWVDLERRMHVPKEIRVQGAAAVANYLKELEDKGALRLNEARIIVLGDKGAGKTCLARRLIDPDALMTTDNESTAGVETMLWKLKGGNINVRIWDFAGHTVTHAVHQFFLSERCLYIMVYDGRTEERNRLEYWLNHMKNYGRDSKAFILVNKRDQHSVDIPIRNLKEQYSIEGGVHTFSIQDDKKKLEDFRNEVAGYIKNNPSWNKQEIPTNYYHVKNELENLFVKGEKEKGQEHITKKKFTEIAKKHDVDEENIDKLLNDLHALGVSLWYKDMEEFDTLVLNPEWISHGVYKIVNWVNEEKKYSLTLADFRTVFKEDFSRYPEEKHIYLFKLMKCYELAYELNRGKELIIPHLLNEDRPKDLPEFPVGESLMLRYRSEQPLPPNTVSRFIVRYNQDIKKEEKNYLVWRYGAVLEDGKGSLALVREEDRTISVAVTGVHKTDYISELRSTLNDIFNNYKNKSQKPELQYRVERYGLISKEVEAKNPLLLPDRQIFNYSNANIPYYDDVTNQKIYLDNTVTTYNITAQNLIQGGAGNQLIDGNLTHNTFNFYDCNIGLQGKLNELAQYLTESDNKDEAKELENVAKALKEAKNSKNEEEVKEKGIANRLKRLVADLSDENSTLNKAVKGIKNGVSIAQDIAQGYNGLVQWLG